MLNSQAAVIVYWEQDGADVTAKWSGTLSTDSSLMTDTVRDETTSQEVTASNTLDVLSSSTGQGYYDNQAGAVTSTSLAFFSDSVVDNSLASFGFTANFILWNDIHISGGSAGAVSELTFNPNRDIIRFNGRTLASLNASSFANTLAWTATTSGDTIHFTTGPVPEPSCVLLFSIGGLTLLIRRR